VIQLEDGRIVSGSQDHTLKIWESGDLVDIDVENEGIEIEQHCSFTLLGHQRAIYCVLQLDNKHLVSGSDDGMLIFWELETQQILATISAHTSRVSCLLQLSGGGLVSGSHDGNLKLWSIYYGVNAGEHVYENDSFFIDDSELDCGFEAESTLITCKKTFKGHMSLVLCALELADNNLASGSEDYSIKIWDIVSGRCLRTLIGHTGEIWCIRQLSSKKLVTGSWDETLKVWDVDTGECLNTLRGHDDYVWCVLELTDGKLTLLLSLTSFKEKVMLFSFCI
jgi:WD40 repeat protein